MTNIRAVYATFIRRHRWTTLAALVVMIVSANQWYMTLTASMPWQVTAVQIAMILATAVFSVAPLPASLIIIVLYSSELFITVPLPYGGWPLYMVAAYVAYTMRVRIVASVFCYLCLLTAVQLRINEPATSLPMMLMYAVNLCVPYAIAMLVSGMIRQQREMSRLRMRLLHAEYVERNLNAVTHLHDEVSTELTSVILSARLGLNTPSSAGRHDQFTAIIKQSSTALFHVHQVIRLLNNQVGQYCNPEEQRR
ncbi:MULTISPECIES: hypothetical protein [unclassified Bifidobacterium]|uniref:hypothetical protein n=1 Tax=unclassified Bifidobacterium TaxID=2608897 RepID=UPI00112CAD49|nr:MULTISPECIES: hypothetical protein [unclassified Bifidobacterium]